MRPPIIAIDGESKTGKTSLGLSYALTIPKPGNGARPHYLRHFDLDVGGYDRANHRFKEQLANKSLVSKSYFLPQQSIRDKILGKSVQKKSPVLVGMTELWYEMLTDFADACEDPCCEAIMFDSWPQVWNLCTMAYLQEKQQINASREKLLEIEYGEPNARMRAIVYAAAQMGKALILVSFLTDDYQKQVVGGEIKEVVVGQKSAAWKYTDKEIDIALRTSMEWVKEVSPDTKEPRKVLKPFAEVRLCGLAIDATGYRIANPDWETFHGLVKALRGEE